MMQSADLGNCDHPAKRGRLNRSADRRIFVEGEVRSKIFVVLEIIFQDAAQSVFIENNDVIQAFAAKGTDQPLDIGVLPRAAWRSKNFVNAHPLGGLRKLVPVYSIAVTEQIPWRSIPREGFEKLPRSPFLREKGSDGEMKRTSATMVEDQEDEEDLEHHRWDEEEVYGDEVLGMVVEKGVPGLRGRFAVPEHVFGDSCLREFDSDLEQLTVDARSAPARIGMAHLADEIANLGT